ncbi:VanW family protein [Candidatus Daviesbacteria bacterium]|nr:VanW family protein [Candidatus Daviesbacteria bacterium]
MLNHILAIMATISLLGPIPEQAITSYTMSLTNRQPDRFVNSVFRDNILLTLKYLGAYKFTLNPGETFAFHEDTFEKYHGKVVKTTNAHFNFQEGFKSDGYLIGDGVCHLASLMNLVAKNAGLEVEAPTNHNFAEIPDIPKEYGVSIYSYPGRVLTNAVQNLYITNNKPYPVEFRFGLENDNLTLAIYKSD